MATAPVTQFTHILDVKWTGSNGTALSGQMVDTGNLEDDVVIQVAGGTSLVVNVSATLTKLRQLMVVAQLGDLSMVTSGGDTVPLKAGAAMIFSVSGGPSTPFTADYTSVTVTNSGGASAVFQYRSLANN